MLHLFLHSLNKIQYLRFRKGQTIPFTLDALWYTVHPCIIILFFFRYVPINSTRIGADNLPNMEDTSVFALSGFQYIIMAVVVTKGYPHKKPLYYNCESSEMYKDDDLGLEGWCIQTHADKLLGFSLLSALLFLPRRLYFRVFLSAGLWKNLVEEPIAFWCRHCKIEHSLGRGPSS